MSRSPRPRPTCQSARAWLQLRNGKTCLAPLTGGTSRLFSAYLHLVDAWLSWGGNASIEDALRSVVALLQRSEWKLAAEAIAHMGDWNHIEQLWPRIKPPDAPLYRHTGGHDGRVVACAGGE